MKHLNFFNTEQAFADAHNTALGKAINRVRPVPEPVDHKKEEQLRFERECHPLPDGTKLTTQQEALNGLNTTLHRVWDKCASPLEYLVMVLGDSVIGHDCAVGDHWYPQPYKAASFAPSSAAVDFGSDGSVHVTGDAKMSGEATGVQRGPLAPNTLARDEAQDPSRFYQLGLSDKIETEDYIYSGTQDRYERAGFWHGLLVGHLVGSCPVPYIVVRKVDSAANARLRALVRREAGPF